MSGLSVNGTLAHWEDGIMRMSEEPQPANASSVVTPPNKEHPQHRPAWSSHDYGGVNSEQNRALRRQGLHPSATVDGKGLWNNWKRSFNAPVFALLDLIDNAVDASWTLLPKSSEHDVQSDQTTMTTSVKPPLQITKDWNGDGIIIRNACAVEFPPLEEILTPFRSGKATNDIGENGVGLKQACASLAEMSLVFTKTADCFGLGLVMEALQREDGPVLPCVEWDLEEDLEHNIRQLAELHPQTWGHAIREYGCGERGLDDPLEKGITNCVNHFHAMYSPGSIWRNYENIFTVVLTRLRHRYLSGKIQISLNATESVIEDPDEYVDRSTGLLEFMKKQLPFRYLHLHRLDVFVNNERIDCTYWENRLVELSRFDVVLNPEKEWFHEPSLWYSDPLLGNDSPHLLRFFVGFDPMRCLEEGGGSGSNMEAPSAMHLYTYSRQSGRLIKVDVDPRSQLGLSSGSTGFRQGLTLILDDFNGTLPLTPTKQEIAFAHSEHSDIHQENLTQWKSAVAHFYWLYHCERFGGKKKLLTDAVVAAKSSQTNVDTALTRRLPLCEGSFISFVNLKFFSNRGHLRVPGKVRRQEVFMNIGRPPSTSSRLPICEPPLARLSQAVIEDVVETTRKRPRRAAALKAARYSLTESDYGDFSPPLPHDNVPEGYVVKPKNGFAQKDGMSQEQAEAIKFLKQENTEMKLKIQQQQASEMSLKDRNKFLEAELAVEREKKRKYKKIARDSLQDPSRMCVVDGQQQKDNDFARKREEQGLLARIERLESELSFHKADADSWRDQNKLLRERLEEMKRRLEG